MPCPHSFTEQRAAASTRFGECRAVGAAAIYKGGTGSSTTSMVSDVSWSPRPEVLTSVS